MHKLFWLSLLTIVCFAASANAMTSTNFEISWDSLNSGGDDISTSTSFILHDTIGEQGEGVTSSTNYSVWGGYRYGDIEVPTITFALGTQENSTEISFTAFNNAGKIVTVSSTGSYSIGNYIGVVENKGLSQIVAVGKVASISGNDLTVDAWEGSPGSISAVPSGDDDYVYRLNGSAAQLGTLSSAAGATSMSMTSVSSSVSGGYTIYVTADGNLTTGSASIGNVSDGAVTIGSSEYGGRTYGSTATSTGSDFAFSTTAREVQKSTTFGSGDRIALIYKAAMASGATAGSYSQNIYYTITANY